MTDNAADQIIALPIFNHTYKFVVTLADAVGRFPKHHRHALGARLERDAIELLATLLRANASRGYKRLTLLNECSILADLLKILIRLAKDTGATNESTYIALSSRLVEIGKMLGGWIKSMTTTNRP